VARSDSEAVRSLTIEANIPARMDWLPWPLPAASDELQEGVKRGTFRRTGRGRYGPAA
jgi:hypothetical protein